MSSWSPNWSIRYWFTLQNPGPNEVKLLSCNFIFLISGNAWLEKSERGAKELSHWFVHPVYTYP